MSGEALADIRRKYAVWISRHVDGVEPRLVDAFATVAREQFLGAPPWRLISEPPGAQPTESADVAALYDNVLVVLDGARSVNNGSPSLHARMLQALGVNAGDRVVHVGAGSGYYSAILSVLAGPRGQVTAIEYDPALADTARRNLEPWTNVTLLRGDGGDFPTETVDRVYVNFGSVVPPRRWVDMLAERGTLVFPLTAPALGRNPKAGGGGVVRVLREDGVLEASFVAPCGFVMAEGLLAGDAARRNDLTDALRAHALGLGHARAADPWADTAGWPRWFGG